MNHHLYHSNPLEEGISTTHQSIHNDETSMRQPFTSSSAVFRQEISNAQLSSSSTSSKASSSSSQKLVPSITAFPSFYTSYEQNRLRMVKETCRYLEIYQQHHSLSAYDRLTSMAARVFKVSFAFTNFTEFKHVFNYIFILLNRHQLY